MVLVKSSLPLLAFRIFSETEAELPFLRRWRGIGPALGNSTGGGGGFDWRRRIGPSATEESGSEWRLLAADA